MDPIMETKKIYLYRIDKNDNGDLCIHECWTCDKDEVEYMCLNEWSRSKLVCIEEFIKLNKYLKFSKDKEIKIINNDINKAYELLNTTIHESKK